MTSLVFEVCRGVDLLHLRTVQDTARLTTSVLRLEREPPLLVRNMNLGRAFSLLLKCISVIATVLLNTLLLVFVRFDYAKFELIVA